MNFTTISENEFRSFLDKHPLKTFLQTPEIGKLRKKAGWKVEYLAMMQDKKILAATMLLSIKKYLGKKEFYAPRGFLLDYSDNEILENFTNKIREYVKNNGGYILRIDPYVINKERDGKGQVVDGGIDNSALQEKFKNLGFKKVEKAQMEQVGWMYCLDIEGKTEDEIMANMKQNCRNIIRKNIKDGIEVIELKKEELDKFYDIMISTGKRKDFHIRKIDYYQDMYDLFHERGEIKYLATKLDMNKHIDILNKELSELNNSLENPKCKEGRKKALKEAIGGIQKKLELASKIKEEHGNTIIMSASQFIMTKPEVVYLSSGNYDEFMSYNSQYLIQWEMIKYAINNGFKRYNFYGITGNFDKNDKDYGIYKFKTGFNGYVEELIGEYEMPISKVYYLIKFLKKLRK